MAKLESISALLVGLAAVSGAVVGVLTYLDSSDRLENPVGNAVSDAFSGGGGGGDDDGNGDSDTTGTTGGPPAVDIQSLTVDTFSCDITVSWDATGDGRLELIRNGTVIDDSLPVEQGSVTENAFDLFGEGNYEVTYELVAKDSTDQETERESASGADSCIV